MSSYEDFVALSNICYLPTAKLISREVSNGIIAPGYKDEALAVLKKENNSSYSVLKIDPNYEPGPIERKSLFGLTFEQKYDDAVIDKTLFQNVVIEGRTLPGGAIKDLIMATIALSTQSNSVCFAKYVV